MTAQEAYAEGFCKTAEAYGFDPEALAKFAEESRDHLEGAIEGGGKGLALGGLLGGGTGATLSGLAFHDLRRDFGLIKGLKPRRAPKLNPEVAKLVLGTGKSRLAKALGYGKVMVPAGLVLALLGAGTGGSLGATVGGIIGKKKKKD